MSQTAVSETVELLSRTGGGKGQAFLRNTWPLGFAVAALFMVLACAAQPVGPPGPAPGCDPVIDKAVQEGDWQKALTDHEQFLARNPGDCLAMYHLGYIYGQMGDRLEEIRYYEQAAQCGYKHDDLLYFNMGMAKADVGDLPGALQSFETAAAINPENPENQFGIGLVYQTSGRSADAEQAWLHAVKLDPRHRESRLALARLYLDQSRWQEARAQLDAVCKIDPHNDEARELKELLRSRQALEYRR